MMVGWRRSRRREPAELQITAFMNLMVVLVPFLLITAVFSQMAVLDLNLPDPNAEANPDEPPPKALTVVIRRDSLLLMDSGGPIEQFPNRDGQHDLAGLAAFLDRVKTRIPEEDKIALLLEADVEYDVLIRTMDTVRLRPGGKREMFPRISIGDAPAAAAAAGSAP